MKSVLFFYIFGLSGIFLTCNSKDFSGADSNAYPYEYHDASLIEKNQAEQISDKKIIQTGNVSFETQNIESTYKFISDLIKEFDAYSSNEYSNNYSGRIEYSLTVRIPSENFDSFLSKLEKHVGRFENKNISLVDVTEEFIDVEARLNNKKELEKRYVELLAKAVKLEDILSLERELNNIRAEIESIEGRLRYLKNQVAMSTLTVTFHEKVFSDFGFVMKVKQALVNGWNGLKWFIIGLISIWPFIIIGTVILIFIRRRYKSKG